ncbi:MAG: GAF domain-containing protein, partial [Ilumatobacter sp.]
MSVDLEQSTIMGRFAESVLSPERLAAVRRSGMLGAEAGRRFAQLTNLASTLTGAPIALISMVESDRQFFTSQVGLPDDLAASMQTPISQSVCRTVVETGAPLELRDLGDDERFVEHGARTELGIEAYCGVPIRDGDGHVLGSFCVLDVEQRTWAPETVELLEQLAGVVADSISTSIDYLSLVTDLQTRLIPADLEPPAVGSLRARYRPVAASERIGGDFYDSFRRRDGSVDIVLGDVVGHGVESTQAAAQLRAAARAVFTGLERS